MEHEYIGFKNLEVVERLIHMMKKKGDFTMTVKMNTKCGDPWERRDVTITEIES